MLHTHRLQVLVMTLAGLALLSGCSERFDEAVWQLGPATSPAGLPGARLHQNIVYIGRDTDDATKSGQEDSFASKTFSCKAPGVQQNKFCNVTFSYSLFHADGESERLKISATPAQGKTAVYFIDAATTADIHSSNTKTETIAVPCQHGCQDEVTLRFELTEGPTPGLQGQTHVDIAGALCDLEGKTNSGGHLADVDGNALPAPQTADTGKR